MSNLIDKRRAMMAAKKEYFHFADPEAEAVVANYIGDGVGTTLAQIRVCTSIGSLFDDNPDVLTFDEFEEFTGLSGNVTDGFKNTNIVSIECPQGKHISLVAFSGNTSLSDLHIKGNCASLNVASTFTGSGTLLVDGNVTVDCKGAARFTNYIIKGDFTLSTNQRYFINTNNVSYATVFRTNGTFRFSSGNFVRSSDTLALKFIELMGTISSLTEGIIARGTTSNCILHLGQSGLAYSSPTNLSPGKFTKIYVGNGSSKSGDDTVLATYIADTNWSEQSAKLATWYDYNGKYKWYYVTDVLTNCTNTNPDEWPHITRGDSYHTQIVAEDGYTLSSVQVQMYQCPADGVTPNTPTDITSSVYNSATGEIDIPSVIGNVIITASAS